MVNNSSDIRMITREDVPCWYELTWHHKTPAGPMITISVRKKILEETFPKIQPKYFTHMQKEIGLGEFVHLGSGTFGFNGSLKVQERKDDFLDLQLTIPALETWTDDPCRSCRGTGDDQFSNDRPCFSCRGKGKERKLHWDIAYNISATLNILFSVIEFPDSYPTSGKSQLMTLIICTERAAHGGSLGGRYSRTLMRWLSKFSPNTELDEVSEAMRVTHKRIFGRADWMDKSRLTARILHDGGWLTMDCPGDACGLHLSGHGRYPNEGREFSCHNVDNPMQQLTLFAGLAALHSMARKAGVA